MDLKTVQKLIKKHTVGHDIVVSKAEKAENYYRNKTDILFEGRKADNEETPLRNADNRVCSSFYSLLVNQKASYLFTSSPLFDTGNETVNKMVSDTLGDIFSKRCKDLCIEASNGGIAWVHYWTDADGSFRYGVLGCKQVIPIWSDELDKRLIGVFRVYTQIDDETGKEYFVYELWNDTECSAYRREATDNEQFIITPYRCFSICNAVGSTTFDNVYKHNFGRVPFIPFMNNNTCTGDLDNIKGLIDTYDKTYSGFANDLEDIQEIIFVLSGYGGTDLKTFLTDLKKYKTVKVDNDVEGGNSGLSTLTIDIPVEARKQLLDMTRKAIFEQGQGVDPDPQKFGNTSGEALKYLYSLLELKAGLLETEFRGGFAELIKAICDFKGLSYDKIIQTWTRTKISNDAETADIINKSAGVISKRTMLENHPLVENADKELERIAEEEQDEPDFMAAGFGRKMDVDNGEE